MITTADVRWACDVLRPAYDATDGVDGRVSIEVDPRLAHDTEQTVAEARQLWWLVDRPNLFIKIPATIAGLPAITQCLAEGISINVTLIFSRRRYAEVMDAFLDGIERARAAGRDLTRSASVASFFVSRVDTEIDQRLDAIGIGRGQGAARRGGDRQRPTGVPAATSEVFAADRWRALARRRGPTAAALVGLDRGEGSGLPRHPLRRRPGRPRRGEHDARGHAARGGRPRRHPRRHRAPGLPRRGSGCWPRSPAIGVDYDDVVDKLERDGLTTFQASWAALAETVEHKLAAAATRRQRRRQGDDHP